MIQNYFDTEMAVTIERKHMGYEDCIKVLNKLPKKEHFVYYLSNYVGMNDFIISRMLSVSMQTVSRYKWSARQKITKIIKEYK